MTNIIDTNFSKDTLRTQPVLFGRESHCFVAWELASKLIRTRRRCPPSATSRRVTWILIKAIKRVSIASRINQNVRAGSVQKRDSDVSHERVDIWPICTVLSTTLRPTLVLLSTPRAPPTLISTYPHSGGRAFILINTQWISHPGMPAQSCFRDPPTGEYRG